MEFVLQFIEINYVTAMGLSRFHISRRFLFLPVAIFLPQVRGQAIAAVSIISSAETFLVPHRVIERRLLELCLQGAVQDIKVSGQTGESETQNALMVMRLVEDFIFTPGNISV